jgi:hypothetical protein
MCVPFAIQAAKDLTTTVDFIIEYQLTPICRIHLPHVLPAQQWQQELRPPKPPMGTLAMQNAPSQNLRSPEVLYSE